MQPMANPHSLWPCGEHGLGGHFAVYCWNSVSFLHFTHEALRPEGAGKPASLRSFTGPLCIAFPSSLPHLEKDQRVCGLFPVCLYFVDCAFGTVSKKSLPNPGALLLPFLRGAE